MGDLNGNGNPDLAVANWRPWEAATGARTADGKAQSARNALKHGGRTTSALAELAEIRRMVRQMEAEEREIRRRVWRYG